MLKRVLIAILIGIIVAIVVYLIGLVIALVPNLVTIGHFIEDVSPIVGILAGIYYFVTGKNPVA